jgi:carboxypeptidase Q
MEKLSLSVLIIVTSFSLSCAAVGDGNSKTFLSSKVKKQAKQLIQNSLKARAGYETIESLTTEVGARLAGSPAEKRARDWAVKKLKSFGLKNVRVEPFKVKHWERKVEKATIVSPYPQNLEITALGGSVSTPKKGVQAEIVSFKTLTELKEAPLKGFKNKIIFVDEKMTRTQDGSGYSVAVKKRSGAAIEAGKRGALAALIRSVGTDHHRFPHTGQMSYEKDVKPVPIAALSAPDADQLARSLKKSNKVVVSLNLQVEANGESPSGNVIGEIPGRTDEIVVIGAHLDSWDLGTGAVDDGAGVGIVVGAANEILKLGKKPERTIRVILFGSEEVGLVGAEAYAKKHKDELDKHFVGAESDFGARKIWRFDTLFGEDKLGLADEMHKILEPLGIARGKNNGYGGPDILPMLKFGVPAVTLKQNGWDYFDLHHTADDTFDKIDASEIAQNVAAYAAFAWMAANIEGSFRSEKKPKP